LEFIGKILKSVVSSFIVSAILFVIIFSLITNEFPPRISRVVLGLKNMEKLIATQQALLGAVEDKANEKTGGNRLAQVNLNGSDEEVVESLERINRERNKTGRQMFGTKAKPEGTPPPSASNPAPSGNPANPAVQGAQPPSLGWYSSPEFKEDVRKLKAEISQLREKVLSMEHEQLRIRARLGL